MRVIYYTPKGKDKNGKPLPVEKYTVDDIDALDALRLHADEYSEQPPKAGEIIDRSAQPLDVKPELLPQGEPVDERGPLIGSPAPR